MSCPPLSCSHHQCSFKKQTDIFRFSASMSFLCCKILNHDMWHTALHTTQTALLLLSLSPTKMYRNSHYLLQLHQVARHSNVVLAQYLNEVQNCLIELTFSCPPTNTPIPPSLLTKKPFHVIVLFSIPGTLPSPCLLILLASPLSSLSLSNIRNWDSHKLQTLFLGFILLKCL